MKNLSLAFPIALVALVGLFGACGSDDDDNNTGSSGSSGTGGGSPEQTGSTCEVASDCYPALDGGTLEGEAMCLDRVQGGYCTHTCTSDDDCCAVDGECDTDLPQVCSPFESTGQNMCFLSCEKADMQPYDGGTGWADDNEFCQREASSDFICRSSGGGSDNRKVCVPGDCGVGAACATTDDCNGSLVCITTLVGGYCGQADCTANADCPNGSVCAELSDGKNYCLRKCTSDTDCSFCRPWDQRTACADDATFVEDGTTGAVCVPTVR